MDKVVYKVFEDKSTHSPTWKGQVLRNGVSVLDVNESDMGKAGMDDIHDVLNLEKYMKKEGMLPLNDKLKLVIAKMNKAQVKAALIAQGIEVKGNFVKKSDIRAYVTKVQAEEYHLNPEAFGQINQHLSNAINEVNKGLDALEEYHQQNEALEPKFRDAAKKAFKKVESDIQELSVLLGNSK